MKLVVLNIDLMRSHREIDQDITQVNTEAEVTMSVTDSKILS